MNIRQFALVPLTILFYRRDGNSPHLAKNLEKTNACFCLSSGEYLYEISHGRDPTPVREKGPPQTISVEDSFKFCTSMEKVQQIVKVLAPDIVERFFEDFHETGRWPRSLVLKWREGGGRSNKRTSCSSTFPCGFSPTKSQDELVG